MDNAWTIKLNNYSPLSSFCRNQNKIKSDNYKTASLNHCMCPSSTWRILFFLNSSGRRSGLLEDYLSIQSNGKGQEMYFAVWQWEHSSDEFLVECPCAFESSEINIVFRALKWARCVFSSKTPEKQESYMGLWTKGIATVLFKNTSIKMTT